MKSTLTVRLARLMAGVFLAASIFMPAAQAGMIGTEQLTSAAPAQEAGARAALEDKLVSLGVDRAEARDRVAALSDAQAGQVLARAEQLPAGAGAAEVIGIIVIVLVITDLIGITDIFPFIDKIGE